MTSLTASAQTAPTTTPSCSNVHFELANPAPGAMLEAGGLVLEGIAFDNRATEGTGIDRIDFFLDNRDEGGLSVGTAMPGSTVGPFGAGSFHTIIDLPDLTGGHDLFGYAHSSVSDQEFIVSIPVSIGEDPSVAAQTAANGAEPTLTQTCTPVTGSAAVTPPSSTEPASTTPVAPTTTAPATTPVSTTPAMSTDVFLDVANPSAGSTVLAGAYSLEGVAYDKTAKEGAGIDRVDVFLDSRDDGGLRLGSALLGMNNPSATPGSQWATAGFRMVIDLPSNQKGLHTLSFYAHSSVTGSETLVEIPVTIE
jgi:hypothetical protein